MIFHLSKLATSAMLDGSERENFDAVALWERNLQRLNLEIEICFLL